MPTPWAEAANEAISLVEPLAAERGITLESRLPDTPNLCVVADKFRLRQVLLNLLSNAVKYNRDGGSVSVVVMAPDPSSPEMGPGIAPGMVRVRVHDTGAGIASDRLDRLFVPFDRLGAETSRTPGAGLGLALTKGLVESMGGAIGVETTEGVGSTFWFELPVAALDDHDDARIGDVTLGADPAPGDATVVVIDDNEANLDLLRRVLALRKGIRVTFAHDGLDGLARVTADPPDLVLLDLHLPVIDGREVLRRIKADPTCAQVSVVVLSGVADAESIRQTRRDGADGYLTKPFDVPELLEMVDALLATQIAPGAADGDGDVVLR
jgi:CheY-like chemotaxis protein